MYSEGGKLEDYEQLVTQKFDYLSVLYDKSHLYCIRIETASKSNKKVIDYITTIF